MFIECAYKDTIVAINLDNVSTIIESTRGYNKTMFTFWLRSQAPMEIDESYESVMSKVRAAK